MAVSKALRLGIVLSLPLLFAACGSVSGNNTASQVSSSSISLSFGSSAEQQLSQLLLNTEALPLLEKIGRRQQFMASCSDEYVNRLCAYVTAKDLKLAGGMDNLKAASRLFEESAQESALWERSLVHKVECCQVLGLEKDVRKSLQELLAPSVPLPAAAAYHYALAQSFMRTQEPVAAKQEFEGIIEKYPKTQFAIGAKYYLGLMCQKNSDNANAVLYFRHYIQECPEGKFAAECVSLLQNIPGFAATVADRQLFGQVYYAVGNWSLAIANWSTIGKQAPLLKLALCYLRTGQAQAGQNLLGQLITNPAFGKETVEAAQMLCKYKDKLGAIAVWKSVLVHCPAAADAALYNLAQRAEAAEALTYYERLVKAYPASDFAPEAYWWLCWSKISRGQWKDALTMAQHGESTYPKSRAAPRFAFWKGKLQERLNSKESAKKTYKEVAVKYAPHYYAWRAQSRLKALSGGADRGWGTHTSRSGSLAHKLLQEGKYWTWPDPDELLPYGDINQRAGSTIATLLFLRQWDECLELLPEKQEPALASCCLAHLGLPLEAINAISLSLQGNFPSRQDCRWNLSYPLLFSDIVAKEAAAKQLDPLLAQGLIREESRYDTQAVSSSNALGLMQLLPGTAYGVAKRLNVPVSSNRDIHKPENNIRFGVDYLAYVQKRFKGNALYAVAGYNGGPNAVERWSRSLPAPDTDSFVENIPFNETRDYVRKVFGSFWCYEALYE